MEGVAEYPPSTMQQALAPVKWPFKPTNLVPIMALLTTKD